MFSIGEFSMITRFTVKTLRYYHDEGLLEPDYVDVESGYRYYRESSVDKAKVIGLLRSLEFSINDIREIIVNYSEDHEVIDFLESQQDKIKSKIRKYKEIDSSIDEMINTIRFNNMKINEKYNVEEKILDDIIFAGHRFKGRYNEVSKAFKLISRAGARYITGKPMSMYYDHGYMENGADIEAGYPVSKTIKGEGIDCRIMKGGKAVTLVHRGSYDDLGNSYEKIFRHINEHKLNVISVREVYLKGPGVIFRGNPEKYLTDIQVLIQ
jgi:DNA-binding transcriptional MerR regulator